MAGANVHNNFVESMNNRPFLHGWESQIAGSQVFDLQSAKK